MEEELNQIEQQDTPEPEYYAQTKEIKKSGAFAPFSVSPVIKFRLILSILVVLAAYIIKLIGGNTFDTVREKYTELMNDTVVIDESKDNTDFIRAAENDFSSR